VEWVTSDNPVIKLNYYTPGVYDFNGGWGNEGTEIIFPLSPSLLLYTQVGKKDKIVDISKEFSMMLNRIIVENAHRYIFALNPIEDMAENLPRVVNSSIYANEKLEWESWHNKQKDLEEEYQGHYDKN
jgi:hypothetical protein